MAKKKKKSSLKSIKKKSKKRTYLKTYKNKRGGGKSTNKRGIQKKSIRFLNSQISLN